MGKQHDGNAGAVHNGWRGSPWRIAAWVGAALLLLLPAVAMQFSDEVVWTASDFIFAAVLLFGSLGAFELATRMTGNIAYRAGAGLAITAAFLLVWVNGAAGITDSDADAMLLLVPVIGAIGAIVARFKPRGMTGAMYATAAVQLLIPLIALIAGIIPAFNSAFEILAITGFFVALWVGSALLFREAALDGSERDEA